MIPWTFPDGTELLIQWLGVLGETRSERPTGAPLPFRTVRRIGGPATELVDSGLYSISDYASSDAEARHQATLTVRRVLLLNQHVDGVYVDQVQVTDGPRLVEYTEAIRRCVTTVQLDLRIVAA